MKYTLAVFAMLIMLCAFSCKKEKNAPVTPVDSNKTVNYANYTRLSPGSYWIYEEYEVDSTGAPGTPEAIFDSCYVEKDTLINGHTYHKYWAPVYLSGTPASYNVEFLRDSLSYTVTSGGAIVFSSLDFTDAFSTKSYTNPPAGVLDTIQVTYQMGYKDSMIAVPAGTFKTSTFRQIYHFSQSRYPLGPDRSYDYTYAENIGQVKATLGFYTSQTRVYERRLVRYHLQ